MTSVTQAEHRARASWHIVLACHALLFVVVWGWTFARGLGAMSSVILAAILSTPLALPLRGLLARNRRTFAWATLCVIPYLVLGLTEAVASPASRTWASLCVALAFTLFLALIAYLRFSRPLAA